MDFGDLLVFFFIVTGILSSILGKKKKKTLPQSGRRRPPTLPPRPPRPQGTGAARGGTPVRSRPGAGGPQPSLDANRPTPFPSQMEEILRQLGLDVARPAPPEPEPVEPEPALEVDAVGRPMPRAVSLESGSLEELEPDIERRHEEFHKEYIRRFRRTRITHYASRAHALLNPKSLRHAVLLHEIFGPPKGLR
jgi:hypothetical protein